MILDLDTDDVYTTLAHRHTNRSTRFIVSTSFQHHGIVANMSIELSKCSRLIRHIHTPMPGSAIYKIRELCCTKMQIDLWHTLINWCMCDVNGHITYSANAIPLFLFTYSFFFVFFFFEEMWSSPSFYWNQKLTRVRKIRTKKKLSLIIIFFALLIISHVFIFFHCTLLKLTTSTATKLSDFSSMYPAVQ